MLNNGVNALIIRKNCSYDPQKDFFTNKPEESAKYFAATITPMIVTNIKAQIEKKYNEKLNINQQHMSDSELVSLRSPILKRLKLYEGIVRIFYENEKIKLPEDDWYEDVSDIGEQITYVILEELVKGDELFLFDPAYYTGGHNLCWLRY